ETGKSAAEIAQYTGYHPHTIWSWLKAYRDGGLERPKGTPPLGERIGQSSHWSPPHRRPPRLKPAGSAMSRIFTGRSARPQINSRTVCNFAQTASVGSARY